MLKTKAPKKIRDKSGSEWVFDKYLSNDHPHENSKRIVYNLANVDFNASMVLFAQDVELKFDREKKAPSSIPIRQGHYECAISSMSMITKKSVAEIKSILIDLGWEVSLGVSFALQKKALRRLGFSSMIHYLPPNQECLVSVPSLNVKGMGHQVYWDGKEILDPQFNTENKWYGPEWGLNEINACYFLTVEKLA